MILIFGYKTPNRHELPARVEIVASGTEALQVVAAMDAEFPRIARLDFPVPRTVKNYRAPAEPAAVKPAKKSK